LLNIEVFLIMMKNLNFIGLCFLLLVAMTSAVKFKSHHTAHIAKKA